MKPPVWRFVTIALALATVSVGLVGILQVAMGRLDTARPWLLATVAGSLISWVAAELYRSALRGRRE